MFRPHFFVCAIHSDSGFREPQPAFAGFSLSFPLVCLAVLFGRNACEVFEIFAEI